VRSGAAFARVRGSVDEVESFPDECRYVIEQICLVLKIDAECHAQGKTALVRLAAGPERPRVRAALVSSGLACPPGRPAEGTRTTRNPRCQRRLAPTWSSLTSNACEVEAGPRHTDR
jgi:hypothetical protein